MSPILLVGYVTIFVDTLLAIAGAAVGVLAFVRAWMSPANAYDFAGKRPKNTWLALTGGSAAVSLFSVFAALTGGGNTVLILQLVAAVISCVFLAGAQSICQGRRVKNTARAKRAQEIFYSESETSLYKYSVRSYLCAGK